MSDLKAPILILGGLGAYLILKKSAATPKSPLGKVASSLGIKPSAPGSFFGAQPTTTNLATQHGTAVAPASSSINGAAAATGSFLSGLLGGLFKGGTGAAGGPTSNKPGASVGSGAGGFPGGSGGGSPTTRPAQGGFQQPVNDITGSFVTSTVGQVYDPETGITYVPGSDADPYAGQDGSFSGAPAQTYGPDDSGAYYDDPLLSAVQPDEAATSSEPDAASQASADNLDYIPGSDSDPNLDFVDTSTDYGAADYGGDDSGG